MSPEPSNSLVSVGTVLEGAYRIDALIGEGGMGAVYAATHLRLNKYVAVKVMARELAANADSLARFHREAQVTSALGHPHIVQVLQWAPPTPVRPGARVCARTSNSRADRPRAAAGRAVPRAPP